MKWTYDWLQDYLETKATPIEIGDMLTRIGLEVEEVIEPVLPIAAKIVACVDIPDTHLHLLQVDDGTGTLRQVVCGAPNARSGLVSALARPGCKIGDMEIKSGKIRGHLSDGMMCSGKELGINDDHDGIVELDENIQIGTPVAKATTSAIFDAGITPNRPDYLAVRGIALDLAAAGIGEFKQTETRFDPNTDVGSGVSVKILNETGCPTYRLCKISGIKNGPSNPTIASRLAAIDINPKNAPIDATNYVCYDLAQPMHCFDADEIQGDIVVRNAKSGEKFTDLFGTEHELVDTDLVITDDAGILALAGVVGGMRGSTTDKTTNIILECAYFDPVTVRKTSRRIGVSTDSSYRYERGIDPDGTGYALARAVDIIMDACGGSVTENHVAGRTVVPAVQVKYNPALFLKKTGIDLSADKQKSILESLKFIVNDENAEWIVTPTHARVDVTIAEDIISELIRLYGYDNIKQDKNIHRVDFVTKVPAVKKTLVSRGFFECMNYGFGDSKKEKMLSSREHVTVLNPIIETFDTVRNSLVQAMLDTIANNDRFRRSNLALFELAAVFDGSNPGQQHDQLIVARTGIAGDKIGVKHGANVSVYDIREDLLALFPGATVENDDNPELWANPYRAGRLVLDAHTVAIFAEVHPNITKSFGIKTNVVIGLIDDVSSLVSPVDWNGARDGGDKIALVEFPVVTRDFAFVTDADFSADKIIAAAKSADARIIEINMFDEFALSDSEKSIAFEVVIQPTDNLSDAALGEFQDAVIAAVEKNCPAKLRG